MRTSTHFSTLRTLLQGALVVAAISSFSCGGSAQVNQADLSGPFSAVPRGTGTSSSALKQGLGGNALPGNPNESFYLAINKAELGKKWFLSAYINQFYPQSSPYAYSLGTRVVSFKIQNGKLFVFDVDDRKKTSETYNPEVIVEAYPIVTNNASFNASSNAADYVLFDPSAGLNNFNVISDGLSDPGAGAKFAVDLMYSQNFRKTTDGSGATFEQVFTGTSDVATGDGSLEGNAFRSSGTIGLAFRRYSEGAEYKPTAIADKEYFFRSDAKLVPNTGSAEQVAAHWNIHPKMKPIEFVISDKVAFTQADPRFKDYDIAGAIKNGIENWNAVFGFKALSARVAKPDESVNQDDKNYIVFDTDPSYGAAYANWRTNPNTGEIRGASVYFSSLWIESADYQFDPANQVTHLAPQPKGTKNAIPSLSWAPLANQPLCVTYPESALAAVTDPGSRLVGTTPKLTKKELVERFITGIVLHEVGHTLGLRHNFKGSLAPSSSSVMEYIVEDERPLNNMPGDYDTAAIKYLYGLSTELPTQLFCTDGDVAMDPMCATFDKGSDPLNEFYGVSYLGVLNDFLTGLNPTRPNNTLNNVLKFVRAGASPEIRLAAWHMASGAVKVPVDAQKVATDLNFAPRADAMLKSVITRLYTDPAMMRGTFANTPPADPTLYAEVLAQTKGVLTNTDKVRTFGSRRSMVDVLKSLQTLAAYQSLLDARAEIAASRTTLTGADLALTDDLLQRIDVANNPYFVK